MLPSSIDRSSGGRLVDTHERVLPLIEAGVQATAAGGLARVVLTQKFRNAHAQPLSVTYSLPLPSDCAVSAFAFTIGERRIVGEIDRRQAARERFEEAILDGRTAALLEHERSSLFTQELGNIPAGAEVCAEIVLDQRLRWLDEGAWELRFPTTIAPRYLGAPGRVADAAAVEQDIADGPIATTFSLCVTIEDRLADGLKPISPSHAVEVDSGSVVRLRGAVLDRDVVIRWPVPTLQPGASVQVARASGAAGKDAAHGLLTIVPPARSAGARAVPRDLIILLDTSGSMAGEPIQQAVRVSAAMIETLGAQDTLELIAFSSSVRSWRQGAVPMTSENKSAALEWLRRLQASGGTEMRGGILAALKPLREQSQRQVVLVTDGLIGFEHEIVHAIASELPRGSRVHTVGVGSSVNRTLTGGAARAGHGVEIILGIGEDPEPAAQRLVARTDAPILVELSIEGSAVRAMAPERLPDLFLGAPALIGLELRPEGGQVVIRAASMDGAWEQRIDVPSTAPGTGHDRLTKLFAREQVEDLESRRASGENLVALDEQIEKLGLAFQIATRLTSWVAIDTVASVDPSEPTRRERMPHALPHGTSMHGLGLRGAQMPMGGLMMCQSVAAPAPAFAAMQPRGRASAGIVDRAARAITNFFGAAAQPPRPPAAMAPPPPPTRQRRKDFEVSEEMELHESAAATYTAEERFLKGRIVLRKSRRLVIEVTIDTEALDWQPTERAELAWANGDVTIARLGRGTRAGEIGVGTVLRLVLDIDDPIDTSMALQLVRLETSSGTLVIQI